MTGERWLLGAGEFLVRLAARRLPAGARDERYQEWAAELPVILGDQEIKPAAARAARMLWFAADTLRGAALRGTALRPDPAHYRGAHRGGSGHNARKSDRWLAAGAAWLTALAASLALLGFLVYLDIVEFSSNLAGFLSNTLSFLAVFAGWLIWRRHARSARQDRRADMPEPADREQ